MMEGSGRRGMSSLSCIPEEDKKDSLLVFKQKYEIFSDSSFSKCED